MAILSKKGLRVYRGYSGRCMYGAKCIGIVVPGCNAAALKKRIRGASVDSMGLDMIVYWPEISDECCGADFIITQRK